MVRWPLASIRVVLTLVAAIAAGSMATRSQASEPLQARPVAGDAWFVQGEAALGSACTNQAASSSPRPAWW
jgi:hypothetical protein